MAKFILTDEAVAHIDNIRDYTRNRWGKQQVKQYLNSLLAVPVIMFKPDHY